ncbi:MAG: hypothetical protein B6D39_11080 [Anaerolineae bacterium UTCFX2]|jgi:hypothetical protein|nr:MAG: hypothetical protein B6D39_11080 [Anaerolineae bacterium UTCFX2]
MRKFNQSLDRLSNFFAARKGLPVIIGIVLILVNGVLQFFPGLGWVVSANLFLHLGIILALVGVLLAWAL